MHDKLLRGHIILVVEDEYFLAHDMARGLEAAGATVLGPVATAEEALEIIKSNALSAGVIDIKLRDGLSFPVVDILIDRSIPFVLVSGYDLALQPSEYQSYRCFLKPTSMSDVVLGIAEAINSTAPAMDALDLIHENKPG